MDEQGTAELRRNEDVTATLLTNEYYPPDDNQCTFSKQTPYLQAMKQKAAASGEPLKFIATFWTPPAAFKDNNSLKGGGRARPDRYADLGKYAVSAIAAYKNIGIDLYALSLQNEPNFKEPYNSCVYDTTQYRDLLKVAGPLIKETFPDTKLFGAEHMVWALEWPDISYEGAIIKDPDAVKQMDIWACHGYGNDGKTPSAQSKESHQWAAGCKNLAGTGKPLWMTETSGYKENWKDAMQLAQAIYAALKYGKISAWVWWQMSEKGLGQYVLMDLGKPGKRYYVSKNYYRYIRPGAVMVDVAVGDESILVTGFTHAAKKTLTLVVINTNEQPKNIALAGDGLPSNFTLYRTSSSEDCTNAGTISNSDSITLPARSVTTFCGSL